MSALQRLFLILAVLVFVAACATTGAVPAGPYAVGSQRVTLGRPWSDISAATPGLPGNLRLLSIDGPRLNRLYITDGLRAGEGLVRVRERARRVPAWRPGMTAAEQVEFIVDSVAAMDYRRVEVTDLCPARMGDADALRIGIAARTEEGLEIAGLAQLAEVGGRLYVILYLAPAEHYFAAGRTEAEAVMASARPAG